MEEMGPVAVWSLPYPSTGGNDRVGGHGEKGELALELLFVAQRSQEGRIILNHLDIRSHRGVKMESGGRGLGAFGGRWMVDGGGWWKGYPLGRGRDTGSTSTGIWI